MNNHNHCRPNSVPFYCGIVAIILCYAITFALVVCDVIPYAWMAIPMLFAGDVGEAVYLALTEPKFK